MSNSTHSVKITSENWNPGLHYNWARPEFSAHDGIGPLDSLYQPGDSIVAIGGFEDGNVVAYGSGVMVAPGIVLTASHVLDEFANRDTGPVFCTFLPDGVARAWLPFETNKAVRTPELIGIGLSERQVVSDLSLVSCVLMSEAHEQHALMMAQLKIELPLPGQRLWAIGFRLGHINTDGNGLTPLVSSGLVTACFPHGRDRNLASPCVEVAMNTLGGMSGGPVFNEDGQVVGIVSSSLNDGAHDGPSYVTLAWDALRFGVRCPWPHGVWPGEEANLFHARDIGLAKISGEIARDDDWNVSMTMTEEEMSIVARTAPDRSR